MRVLVTRPRDDAHRFMEALRADGHDPVFSPALVMHPEPGPGLSLGGYAAILVTSANAVKALSLRTQDRNALLLCVGAASAAKARALGFTQVVESGGEGVTGLVAYVRTRIDPQVGVIFYPSARDVAGALQKELSASGYRVERQIVYRMDLAETLTPEAQAALRTGILNAVAYFSARSVGGTAGAVARSGLSVQFRGLLAVCLSPAVESAARTHHTRTLSANAATEDAMRQALDLARHSGL